jgi:hypothetical protein
MVGSRAVRTAVNGGSKPLIYVLRVAHTGKGGARPRLRWGSRHIVELPLDGSHDAAWSRVSHAAQSVTGVLKRLPVRCQAGRDRASSGLRSHECPGG